MSVMSLSEGPFRGGCGVRRSNSHYFSEERNIVSLQFAGVSGTVYVFVMLQYGYAHCWREIRLFKNFITDDRMSNNSLALFLTQLTVMLIYRWRNAQHTDFMQQGGCAQIDLFVGR